MPTYLYKCSNCGEWEEFSPRMKTDDELCPKCGRMSRKLINCEGGIKESTAPWWITGKGYATGTKENPDPGVEGTRSRGAFEMLKNKGSLVHPSQIDTREKYQAQLKKAGLVEAG